MGVFDLFKRKKGNQRENNTFKEYYESGQLKIEKKQIQFSGYEKEKWVNNKWVQKTYYENGELNSEGIITDDGYSNEYPVNYWKYYYDNGQLESEGNYSFNPVITNNWWTEEGLWKYYYRNGNLKMEGELEFNGLMGVSKKGYWKFYYENGNLKMEGDLFGDHSFSKEITESGLWKFYHENGKLFNEGKYTEGKREEIWKVFSEEGLLTSKITYKNGEIV